jgi:hypothetical protein
LAQYKGGLLFEGGNTVFNSHVLQMLHPYKKKKFFQAYNRLRLAVLLFHLFIFYFLLNVNQAVNLFQSHQILKEFTLISDIIVNNW